MARPPAAVTRRLATSRRSQTNFNCRDLLNLLGHTRQQTSTFRYAREVPPPTTRWPSTRSRARHYWIQEWLADWHPRYSLSTSALVSVNCKWELPVLLETPSSQQYQFRFWVKQPGIAVCAGSSQPGRSFSQSAQVTVE